MMWWGHESWSVGDWLAMSLMMLAFWGLLAALVVAMVRNSNGRAKDPGGARQATDRPDEVLAERFARGEIDEEEFTRRRALLHATPGSSTPTGGA